MPLPIKVEPGQDTKVRVTHNGKKYVIAVALHVFEVEPGPGVDAAGMPQFNLKLGPVMSVTEEKS